MECERLGAMIRTCRMEKRLTQWQLADMLDVSDRTVSKWERCRGCPDISLLAGLSRILGADLEELLEGNEKGHRILFLSVIGEIEGHEILNETDRQQVYEDLLEWLEEHRKKKNRTV